MAVPGRTWRRAALCGALLVLSILLPEWSLGQTARKLDAAIGDISLLGQAPALLAVASLAIVVYLPFFRAPMKLPPRTLFVALTVLSVIVLRWPAFALFEMNPDESTELAGAATLLRDPRYWLVFDGGTHGPVVEYMLLAPRLAGMACDYGAAHFMAALLSVGVLLCLFGVLRQYFSEQDSRAAVTPFAIAVAQITHNDFLSYNGELPALVLLAGAAFCCVVIGRPPVLLPVCLGGALLGLVPYTKLQAMPLAAILAGVVCFRLIPARQAAGAFLLSMAAPSLLVALYLWTQDLFEYFWASQVLNNLSYLDRHVAEGMQLRVHLGWVLTKFVSIKMHFALLVVSLGALILLASMRRGTRPVWWMLPLAGSLYGMFWWNSSSLPSRMMAPVSVLIALGLLAFFLLPIAGDRKRLFAATLLCLLAGLYAIIRPGNYFDHYLLLVLFPFGFLAVIVLALLFEQVAPHPFPLSPRGKGERGEGRSMVMPALAITFMIGQVFFGREFDHGHTADETDRKIVAAIRDNSPLTPSPSPSGGEGNGVRGGDALAIWGWMERYHVLTGLPCATRFANTYWLQKPGPLRDYFRRVYIEDFTRRPPAVFVDASGETAFNALSSHESFPGLRRRIDSDYRLVADVRGTRVFVRR